MKKKKRKIDIDLIVIGIVFVLIVGRFFNSPVILSIVVGQSMKGTYDQGDILVGVSSKYRDFDVGDVVIWCASKFECISHRIVEVHGDYIQTKGDANLAPDYPVPRDSVRYVIVYRVPRAVVFGVLGGYFVFKIWKKYKQGRLREEQYYLSTYVFSGYLFLLIVILLMSPSMYFTTTQGLVFPNAKLVSYDLLDDGSVIFNYNVYGLRIIDVRNCTVDYLGERYGAGYTIYYSSVRVLVPNEVYIRMRDEGVFGYNVSMIIGTSKGIIKARYYVSVPVYALRMSVDENKTRICVFNANYFPVRVNITMQYADDYGEKLKSKTWIVDVYSRSESCYNVEKHLFLYYDMSYELRGEKYFWRMKVFDG